MVKVTLPDGSVKDFKAGVSPKEIAESIGKRLASDALAAKVDGRLVDLFFPITKDAKFEVLTWSHPDGKKVFWHSAAHVLAHAIKNLYPKAKNTIGPATEDGFFYDFDDLPIKEDDFPKIEEEMMRIAKSGLQTKRFVWTLGDVKKNLGKNPYKVELAADFAKQGWELTAYSQGDDFVDLCEGPHVPSTASIKAVKLTKLAGAYWRGDQKNKQLTRIYGVAFPSDKELKEYVALHKEMEKRDHRKIGREMDLFTFSDLVGSGLPLFTPKGTIIRDELAGLSESLQKEHGFQRVWIPHIAKTDLYKKSGHWDKFGKELFLVQSQETSDQFVMKPMNCPHHAQIYASRARSYRDLPLRYFETTTIYRDEKSGELTGLSRVRSPTQDDAHIFCRADQIEQEFENIMNMIKKLYAVLGMSFKCRLSFRDPKTPAKYLGESKQWDDAEKILERVAKKLKLDYAVVEGEAAFYGPKIDVMVLDALGRQWQCATEQLDFVQPARFGLAYVDADNKEKTPVMIHKALLGSIERFMSVYIEHTAGHFPLWLSPEQVRVLTVSNRFDEYASQVNSALRAEGIRVEFDTSAETLNKKIREAELAHVNYILVIGDKEVQSKTVNVRTRDNKILGQVTVDTFLQKLNKEIVKKNNAHPENPE
ncbi:threonine--tRNA ligase [Candidatus Woesearchaeota archaeon]|nr:threonine--tRNA ligase [Candidatus Woesearchaeota archaeon]